MSDSMILPLVVMLTDKSGKFAVCSMEMYLRMGEMHTKNDVEVEREVAAEIQREYNGHASMWIKMAGMGENWGHQARIREACIQHSATISPMYQLLKDHKAVKEGELPTTRPVISGYTGMGVSLSDIASEYLEAIANAEEYPIEVVSTEDFVARINRYNKRIDEEKEAGEVQQEGAVLVGADAKALFPSMLAEITARIAGMKARKTNLLVEGTNYKENMWLWEWKNLR